MERYINLRTDEVKVDVALPLFVNFSYVTGGPRNDLEL